MARFTLIALVALVTVLCVACGGENNTPKVEKVPFSGAPDRNAVETANTGEARAAIGTLQTALKGALLTKFEGNVEKLANKYGGQMTDAKATELLGQNLDGNTYKTGDYNLQHLGGGKFKVTVAAGTRKEVVQEISAK